MLFQTRLGVFLIFSVICSPAMAQTPGPAASEPGIISLDVVVNSKSGPPVADLQQGDFTILDNKVPQPISSFRAVRGHDTPTEVVVVVDDVNTGYDRVAFERSQIDKFLRDDNGSLSYPTALAILTDSGLRIQDGFSTDGNALSASLDHVTVPLHTVLRDSGIYGADERLQLSLNAFYQLIERESKRDGRKIILWVSPGWPLLSGPGVETQMDDKQRQQVFDNAVRISSLLRLGHITLYSIDPLGASDFGGRATYWAAFTKGVSNPRKADWGNIALQVLAVQSGGLALTVSNDIAAELHRCLSDLQSYYELSYVPSADQKPTPYHQIEVRVDKPGLQARTRTGYYARP
jgi:VWFA-related protein